MTKRIKQKTVAAGGVPAVMISTLFAAAAYANVVTVTLDPNLPADYSMYSYVATDGSAQNNIPVAPYPTTLSDTDGTYNNVPAFTICYDYNNPTNVGQGYTGHFATFTDIATMQTTYLANKMKLAGLAGAPIAVKGALSLAMWEIMFPSSTKTDGSSFSPDPAAQSYEAEAAAAVANGSWTVADSALYPTFMPDNTASQRFGMFLPGSTPVAPTETPEPGTLALIGFGLLTMGTLLRGKSQSQS